MAQRSSRKRRKQRQRSGRAGGPAEPGPSASGAAAEGASGAPTEGASGAAAEGASGAPTEGASGAPTEGTPGATAEGVVAEPDAMARGYARGRAQDEAARAALVPLAEGERPTAVTVGALVAAGLALAELIRLVIDSNSAEISKIVRSVLAIGLLGVIAWGMWRVRYWAVLGMQTLLGITIVSGALAAMFTADLTAAVLVIAIIVPAGALFWFLVKSLARIQMPQRPGTR